jgi:hypothetical protein
VTQPISGPQGPAGHAIAVTPADTALTDAGGNPILTRGICFAGAGALSVVMAGGETCVFPSGSLAAGIVHPIMATQIRATGTTASGIVAVF